MSKTKSVNFDPLIRNLSTGSDIDLDVDKYHEQHPRYKNNYRLDPRGKPMSVFGISSSNYRDPDNPEESKTALWWTREEKKLAQLRNNILYQRLSTIKKIMEKKIEIKDLNKILEQMKDANIEDPIFKKDIDELKTEIRNKEIEIDILDKNIENIETLINNISNEDYIIIEERHKHHTNDNDWIKSVIKKLPHLNNKDIINRYNELTYITGGVKKKSKKRKMIQRKSKKLKLIKTKSKKSNKKHRSYKKK